MRAASACAPAYGVAGSPVVPITRIGAVPRTCTSPSLSPLAGFGMPTHDAVANDAAPGRELRLEVGDVGELARRRSAFPSPVGRRT